MSDAQPDDDLPEAPDPNERPPGRPSEPDTTDVPPAPEVEGQE